MKNVSEKSLCMCNDTSTLIIDRRSASRIVAGLLFCSFFIFTAGYFLGKKNNAEESLTHTEHTAFADQLSYAMNSAYNATTDGIHDAALEQDLPELVEQVTDMTLTQTGARPKTELAVPLAPQKTEYHQAFLFGGTKQAVTDFAARCQQRGMLVEVKQRTSRSKRGKMIHWYQATTPRYTDKTELLALVDTIKKAEKLKEKDIQVISIH